MITPERLAKPGTEHAEQSALFCWIADQSDEEFPGLEKMFAIPNGGERDRAVAGRLKAEGVRAGVPDTFLPVARGRYRGLWIEMKRRNLFRPNDHLAGASPKQKEYIHFLKKQGYIAEVAYGWEHAADLIRHYYRLGPSNLGGDKPAKA